MSSIVKAYWATWDGRVPLTVYFAWSDVMTVQITQSDSPVYRQRSLAEKSVGLAGLHSEKKPSEKVLLAY